MSGLTKLPDYLKIAFFGIYVFSLPVSGVTAVQSISFGLFGLLVFATEYDKFVFKDILEFKKFLIVILSFLAISYLSLFFSIDVRHSLKEINSELLRNIAVMLLVFLYFKRQPYEKIKIYINLIYVSLLIHSIINIYLWYKTGFEFGINNRMGGLLDGAGVKGGGAGERFGVWATFFLSFSLSLWYFKSKKMAIVPLFIAIFSIVANQTRATHVAVVLISIFIFIIMIKSRRAKAISFILTVFLAIGFYKFSDNLSNRYNISHTGEYIRLIKKSPYEMRDFKELDYSIATRLSMWKSALLYRLDEPFIPTGYGRFLYGRSIDSLMEPNDKPFVIYPQVHNEFIGVFFSLGFFGLLIFLVFWFYYFRYSLSLLRGREEVRGFGFFAFFGGIGFVASLCFGSFFGDSEAKLFYLLFGIVLALNYKKDDIAKDIRA